MPVVPSLGRRLACVLYETLLLLSVWFVAAFPLAPFLRSLDQEIAIPVTQFYLLTVAGLYFTLFWRRGQTLAMKTWGIRMEAAGGGSPSLHQAWLRFLLACLNVPLGGIGWWSAKFARDGQFLQDRWAGTRLVKV
jgi:uncharacterized RDD family membrane protein YckC